MSNLEELEEIAKEEFDGHYTIMRFTTNWRVAFGTLHSHGYEELRAHIELMAVGKTLDEACSRAIKSRCSLYDL